MLLSKWQSFLTTDNVLALLTAVAVTVAAWQIRANARLSREALARQLWLDYIKAGLAYPMLSETRAIMGSLETSDVEKTVDGSTELSQQYLWMITLMLDSCDSIIRYLPKREWRQTLQEQVRMHRPALEIIWEPALKSYYSAHIQELVQQGLDLPVRPDERTPVTPTRRAKVARSRAATPPNLIPR